MKKLINSVYFNIILAVITAIFVVMQEVWIDSPLSFWSLFGIGTVASICFSWGAEVIKIVFADGYYKTKHAVVGAVAGIVVAIVTALLVV